MSEKIRRIAETYATKTDLTNRLSYDSGVKTIIGVRHTSTQIRMRYENQTDEDLLYYFAPINLIGLPTIETYLLDDAIRPIGEFYRFFQFLKDVNLPQGLPFFANIEDDNKKRAIVRSMDEDRKLHILAASMSETFVQILNIKK